MRRILRARTPIFALAFIGLAVLFIAACSTNEVDIPGLSGPSGNRLFITMEASPDKVFIKSPSQNPTTSRLTLQLKNQLGEGVPNAQIAVKIVNANGSEVRIGSLDHVLVRTDAAGFARLTYTAPSTAEQPVPVQVFIRAILTDPAYAFEVVSTHQLDLELRKDFDCVAGPGAPDIAFSFNPTNPNEDELVCFDAQATSGSAAIISFSWNFGDGGTDTGAIACHTFRSDGLFPVTLTVVDANQNCISLTQFVTVGEGGAPACVFTASPNPVNTDTVVLFNASGSQDADGQIVSFRWNFGDGSTGNGEIVSHAFDEEGAYVVTLAVTDNAGNETVCTQTITVASGLPTCDFSFEPSTPNTGDTVTFDGSASADVDGGTLEFAWDFDGDGQFDDGTGEVDTFTYSTEGTFLVTLRVTDDEGNVVTCSQSVTVGSVPPTCSFTASPSTANVGDTVNFNATASSDDGTITNFAFDFGDGTAPLDPNTDPTVSHVFTTEGSFIVTLTVTDNDGNNVSCTQTVTVGSVPPTCSFTASPTSASVGQTVNFNATASTDDGTITNFGWDFGDGNTLDPNTDPTVSHVFTANGTFVVTLTLTDEDGNTTACTQNVVVGNALPLCSFSAAPNSGTPPLAVNFDASASADQDEAGASIVSYAWDFDDGNSEINPAPTDTTSHTFTTDGVFDVQLTVTDDEGGTSTCQRTITTTGATPNASFTVAPNPGTAGVPSNFDASGSSDNDESGNSIVQYSWDFGDGSAVVTTNTAVTPHTFVAAGVYSVTLTVTDDELQTDTANIAYTVNP